MKSFLKLIAKLPFYVLFRNFGKPVILPFNYTLSLTYKCNSKCKTCKIWKLKKLFEKELKTEEWIKIIKSFGKSPFWITLSGGEPFLRKDLEEIVNAINQYNQPRIITIPTNGIINSSKRIEVMLKSLDECTLIINFSLDGIGKLHDFLRGVNGNWKKLLRMYKDVKKLKKKYENLIVGVHTVLSKWNIDHIPKLYTYVKNKLKPDQYIAELAENRKELQNLGEKIAPPSEKAAKILEFLSQKTQEERWEKISRLTKIFRIKYYNYVKNLLLKRQEYITSYAGFASVHLTPLGEVWDCAVEGNELGKLEEFDYNFKKLWKSKKAEAVRRKVKKTHKCILANEFYSNALLNLFKIHKFKFFLKD